MRKYPSDDALSVSAGAANAQMVEATIRDYMAAHPELLSPVVDDPVSHPAHYTSGKFETIDVIEDWRLNFHLGNAVKYISRAGKKDAAKTAEDLRKAVWYINREISRLERV